MSVSSADDIPTNQQGSYHEYFWDGGGQRCPSPWQPATTLQTELSGSGLAVGLGNIAAGYWIRTQSGTKGGGTREVSFPRNGVRRSNSRDEGMKAVS